MRAYTLTVIVSGALVALYIGIPAAASIVAAFSNVAAALSGAGF